MIGPRKDVDKVENREWLSVMVAHWLAKVAIGCGPNGGEKLARLVRAWGEGPVWGCVYPRAAQCNES
jgi:hypothetical protein